MKKSTESKHSLKNPKSLLTLIIAALMLTGCAILTGVKSDEDPLAKLTEAAFGERTSPPEETKTERQREQQRRDADEARPVLEAAERARAAGEAALQAAPRCGLSSLNVNARTAGNAAVQAADAAEAAVETYTGLRNLGISMADSRDELHGAILDIVPRGSFSDDPDFIDDSELFPPNAIQRAIDWEKIVSLVTSNSLIDQVDASTEAYDAASALAGVAESVIPIASAVLERLLAFGVPDQIVNGARAALTKATNAALRAREAANRAEQSKREVIEAANAFNANYDAYKEKFGIPTNPVGRDPVKYDELYKTQKLVWEKAEEAVRQTGAHAREAYDAVKIAQKAFSDRARPPATPGMYRVVFDSITWARTERGRAFERAEQAIVPANEAAEACRSFSPMDGLPGVPIEHLENRRASVEMWQARPIRGVNYFDFNNPTGTGSSAPDYSGMYSGSFTLDSMFNTDTDLMFAFMINNPKTLTVTTASVTISGANSIPAYTFSVTGPLNADGTSFTTLTGSGTVLGTPANFTATGGTFMGSGGAGSTLAFAFTIDIPTLPLTAEYTFTGTQ